MLNSQGDAADPPVIGSVAAGLRCYFHSSQSDGQPPSRPRRAGSPHSPLRRHEVHRERQERLPLRRRRAGQQQRELRQVYRGGQPSAGSQGEAAEPGPGQCQQAASGGQRAGAGPNPQRQHGLLGAAHPHSHGARRPQAVQDRDAAPGLQLHLAPCQRAAAGRGQPRRPALPQVPERPAGRRSCHQPHAQAYMHLLSQQPEENGQR